MVEVVVAVAGEVVGSATAVVTEKDTAGTPVRRPTVRIVPSCQPSFDVKTSDHQPTVRALTYRSGA